MTPLIDQSDEVVSDLTLITLTGQTHLTANRVVGRRHLCRQNRDCPLPRVKGQWDCPVMATRSGHPGADMPGLVVRDVVAHLCAVCQMCWPGG